MSRTWLTVDTDDAHHRPWQQGHPSRSKDPAGQRTPRQPSERWLTGLQRFGEWVHHTQHAVTVFVIKDQLDHTASREALLQLAAIGGTRLTFASHGSSHRSWGAWPEDAAALTEAVRASLAANAEGRRRVCWVHKRLGPLVLRALEAVDDCLVQSRSRQG